MVCYRLFESLLAEPARKSTTSVPRSEVHPHQVGAWRASSCLSMGGPGGHVRRPMGWRDQQRLPLRGQ
jgi:hypothetical protein